MSIFKIRRAPLFLVFILSVGVSFAFDYGVEEEESALAPLREFSIIVTKEGYYPQNFSVFAGERVRFFVTSTTKEDSCFTLPEKNIFVSAVKGKLSVAAASFNRSGVYKFYCPVGNIFGKLTVIGGKKKIDRRVSSENKKRKIWMPRDY